MNSRNYDLMVIGGGAAGSNAATTVASTGARVALIERDKLGGTCLNYGCDPTKTLLHIASMFHHAQHPSDCGLYISAASIDWSEIQSYLQEVVTRIRGGNPEEAQRNLEKEGISVWHGEASFLSPHEVSVNGETLRAERIIIATGSQTIIPSIQGLEQVGFLTNVEAIALPKLPKRLAVVGGGSIGLEFAQLFQRFGVEVTVLERSKDLLEKEDRELAEQLCALLSQEGIRLETGAEVQRVEVLAGGKRLYYKQGDKEGMVEADEILLALGRRPTLEKLNLDRAGIKTEKQGIIVDKTLRTSVPHIWAAGDITGDYQFTHVAAEQGKLVAKNAFADEPEVFVDHVIPWVTYTEPPLAHVGKTEEQLREAGISYQVGKQAFNDIERAISNAQTEGLVKLLVGEHGHILGGHILGVGADDLLAPVILAMSASLPVSSIATSIFPYPTLSEAVRKAASSLEPARED